ncbi:MAG TPA: methyltransferase domain-containing protein [Lacipirellulaceae bacterium]|jgi:SAM-dependent methyltransferase|nr:methyltransferase domain-containing protein [Lacipirellulaceae bacterium]
MDLDLYEQQFRVEKAHWWFRAKRHILWTLVDRYSPARSEGKLRVCELGCGTGANLDAVKDRYEVVGVDSSPQALEYARSRLGARVFQGELPADIDLPKESFEVVVVSDVLEHIEDDRGSLATAMRLLKPGGIVVATVPANPWLYCEYDVRLHHVRRYSKPQFRTLMNSGGGEIKLLSYFNTLLFAPAVAVRLLGKLMPKRDPMAVLELPTAMVNEILASTMKSEAMALGRVPLPFGLSLAAVVKKSAV